MLQQHKSYSSNIVCRGLSVQVFQDTFANHFENGHIFNANTNMTPTKSPDGTMVFTNPAMDYYWRESLLELSPYLFFMWFAKQKQKGQRKCIKLKKGHPQASTHVFVEKDRYEVIKLYGKIPNACYDSSTDDEEKNQYALFVVSLFYPWSAQSKNNPDHKTYWELWGYLRTTHQPSATHIISNIDLYKRASNICHKVVAQTRYGPDNVIHTEHDKDDDNDGNNVYDDCDDMCDVTYHDQENISSQNQMGYIQSMMKYRQKEDINLAPSCTHNQKCTKDDLKILKKKYENYTPLPKSIPIDQNLDLLSHLNKEDEHITSQE
jgi:hypothetical protein